MGCNSSSEKATASVKPDSPKQKTTQSLPKPIIVNSHPSPSNVEVASTLNVTFQESRSQILPTNQETKPASTSLSSGLEFYEAVDTSKNLFLAIKRGNTASATEIIKGEQQQSVNRMLGMWNSTPLIVALQYSHSDIASVLLVQSDVGDVNHRNEKGACAMLYASMEGLEDMVRLLLKLGAAVDCEPTSEPVYNPLTDKSLICTPLSIAVSNGRQTIVRMLIDAGCDCHAPFSFPLLRSIRKTGQHSNAGDVKSAMTGVKNVTPLLLACATGQLCVVRELLWRKCGIEDADSDLSTALHHLCRAKADSLEMFLELKKHDLLPDSLLQAKDCAGDSALHIAVDCKQEELTKALLEEGCSASCKNSITGVTALHLAVKRKSLDLVTALLEYGADPLVLDKQGASPLTLVEKLRPDNEIFVAISKAATAWQTIRGVSIKVNNFTSVEPAVSLESTSIPVVAAQVASLSLVENKVSSPVTNQNSPVKSQQSPEIANVKKVAPTNSAVDAAVEAVQTPVKLALQSDDVSAFSPLLLDDSYSLADSDDFLVRSPSPSPPRVLVQSAEVTTVQPFSPPNPKTKAVDSQPALRPTLKPAPPKKRPTGSFNRGNSAQLARNASKKDTSTAPSQPSRSPSKHRSQAALSVLPGADNRSTGGGFSTPVKSRPSAGAKSTTLLTATPPVASKSQGGRNSIRDAPQIKKSTVAK